MKKLLLITLVAAGCGVKAQVIYVSSKNDIRYIKYTDSLIAWCRAEYIKSEHRKILDSRVNTLGDYMRLVDSLGYVNTFDRVVKKGNKEYAENEGVSEPQQIELVWSGRFGKDIDKACYTIKIKRPVTVVVNNENATDKVKIQTSHIDTNRKEKMLSVLWFHGDKLDSSKTYSVTTPTH